MTWLEMVFLSPTLSIAESLALLLLRLSSFYQGTTFVRDQWGSMPCLELLPMLTSATLQVCIDSDFDIQDGLKQSRCEGGLYVVLILVCLSMLLTCSTTFEVARLLLLSLFKKGYVDKYQALIAKLPADPTCCPIYHLHNQSIDGLSATIEVPGLAPDGIIYDRNNYCLWLQHLSDNRKDSLLSPLTGLRMQTRINDMTLDELYPELVFKGWLDNLRNSASLDHSENSVHSESVAKSDSIVPTCPITLCSFVCPVTDRRGHSFEQEGIQRWLQNHKRCPLSPDEEVLVEELRPNYSLKRLVTFLKDGPVHIVVAGGGGPGLSVEGERDSQGIGGDDVVKGALNTPLLAKSVTNS